MTEPTEVETSGLLADPAQTTELEELRAKVSTLEAEVVKQRIIAKNATDHWRQSSILASLRAANAQRGLELRKLNDAMARKNRIIAKRTAERDALLPRLAELDALHARIDAATAELKKWDALATRESEWMPCRAALAALAGDQPKAACECFVVPEEQWTRHYDATEPGSMVEQNPDCPVHPAKQANDTAGDLP